MNRREAERLTRQADTLRALGFTQEEAEALRRISMTLRRWYELECGTENGCIERDEKTGRPYWQRSTWYENAGRAPRQPIADREKGALKRLAAVIKARNEREWSASPCPQDPDNFWIDDRTGERVKAPDGAPTPLQSYIQSDPRGAALYILRPGDVPAGEDPAAYYNRGICVY